ncbi:MAG: type II secretion system F family protein [Pseudomonadota bacterium]
MPTYAWEGKSRSGDTRRGTIEAEDEAHALARLRTEQITPTKLKKHSGAKFSLGGGVSPKELVIFTRQFATMIDAGLPLVQCLDILGTQSDNKKLGKVLLDVKSQVESGITLSEALKRHPKIFDGLYVNLVAAGEVGGILDTILQRLCLYIEKAVKLKRQVRGAMSYPSIVMAIAIIVVAVLLGKVIPVFQNMFKEFKGGTLPAPTQVVINISASFRNNWYLYFGGITGGLVGFSMFMNNEKGRAIFDRFILNVPIIGPVMRKIAVARFTRTLGTLLSSGMPIMDSLEIVAKTAGNMVVRDAILYARQKVSEGKDIATPLAETKVFPPMVVQMIGVGEQTGAMDAMMQKIADFYEDEVDVAVAALTSMLEPLMMVFLGGIIGGLMIAMYMPIFEMAGAVSSD